MTLQYSIWTRTYFHIFWLVNFRRLESLDRCFNLILGWIVPSRSCIKMELTHKVGQHRQSSDAKTTKRGSCGDVPTKNNKNKKLKPEYYAFYFPCFFSSLRFTVFFPQASNWPAIQLDFNWRVGSNCNHSHLITPQSILGIWWIKLFHVKCFCTGEWAVSIVSQKRQPIKPFSDVYS